MSSSGSSEVKGQKVKPFTRLQRCLFKRGYLKKYAGITDSKGL